MALIAQLGEHCTGIADVVGSNPAQSLNFSGLCSSSVPAALTLMTINTQLLLMDKLISRLKEHRQVIRFEDKNSKVGQSANQSVHSTDFNHVTINIVDKACNFHERLFVEAWSDYIASYDELFDQLECPILESLLKIVIGETYQQLSSIIVVATTQNAKHR